MFLWLLGGSVVNFTVFGSGVPLDSNQPPKQDTPIIM